MKKTVTILIEENGYEIKAMKLICMMWGQKCLYMATPFLIIVAKESSDSIKKNKKSAGSRLLYSKNSELSFYLRA